MTETNKMLEECANYLLNHCFVLGGVEDQRAKYLYVQDHLNEVRAVFAPLGYSVVLYPAPLQAAALVNEHEGSQARLLKYESILLLVLRLLYLQKRESLSASADQVLVTVEEVQAELQKMNLPRRLDQPTLEKLLRTTRIKRDTVIYMDYGSRELSFHPNMAAQFGTVTSLLLERKINLTSRIVPGGDHSEASWENQIPFFMNILLYHLE